MDRIPGVGKRALWLIVTPTFCAFVPWIIEGLTSQADRVPLWVGVFSVCSPVAGLLGVLGFKALSRQVVSLWAYVPFALTSTYAGASFTIVLLGPASDGAPILFYPFMCLVLQPFIVLAGGLVSFVQVEGESRGA